MVDWSSFDLVVFDVDGTLYDQSWLRLRMAAQMMGYAVLSGSIRHMRIIRAFRQCREELSDAGASGFEQAQYALASARSGYCETEVRDTVMEWIEQRPLGILRRYIVPGVTSFFQDVALSGRAVAIFSDYPVQPKLAALGLTATIKVCACDPDVGHLKPHPAGLEKILAQTGVRVSRAVMIGDRFDRDWAAANAIGMTCLIRSRKRDPRAVTFRNFLEPVFRLPNPGRAA